MRPSYFHASVTGVYPTLRLGWLSTYFFAVESINGMFLMVFYTPSPLVAYDNMLNILSNVPFGQVIRDIHRLGAEAMVMIVMLHMLRTYLTGSYKRPRQFTWVTGMILLLTTLILSFSGYLLPWDQLAYWAITVGTSVASYAPGAGPILKTILLGGPEVGQEALTRFYGLHVMLSPGAILLITSLHLWRGRKDGGLAAQEVPDDDEGKA